MVLSVCLLRIAHYPDNWQNDLGIWPGIHGCLLLSQDGAKASYLNLDHKERGTSDYSKKKNSSVKKGSVLS